MKVLRFLIGSLCLALYWSAHAQGTILFNNRIPGVFDYPILANSRSVGTNFTAQLFFTRPGPGNRDFQALLPATSFQNDFRGYLVPVVVSVPGVGPGERVAIEMRVFMGPDWEHRASRCEGISRITQVTLGGEGLPPAQLLGIGGIDFDCIPEPSSALLALFTAGVVLAWRRLKWRA